MANFSIDQLIVLNNSGKRCLVKCGVIFFEVPTKEVNSICRDWKSDKDEKIYFEVTNHEESEFFSIDNVEQIKL